MKLLAENKQYQPILFACFNRKFRVLGILREPPENFGMGGDL
jgi:hypothetical protein